MSEYLHRQRKLIYNRNCEQKPAIVKNTNMFPMSILTYAHCYNNVIVAEDEVDVENRTFRHHVRHRMRNQLPSINDALRADRGGY